MKKIYFTSNLENLHAIFKSIIEFPPNDYVFLIPDASRGNQYNNLTRKKVTWRKLFEMTQPFSWYIWDSIKFLSHNTLNHIPSDVDLVFSTFNSFVYEKIPWIVAVDDVSELAYYDYDHNRSRFYQLIVDRAFSSCYCKKIMPWCREVMDKLLSQYDCKKFEDKIEIVYPAVYPKKIKKFYNKSKITLLFCGTTHYEGFHSKGGKEILEAFSIINNKYSNLELIIRSSLPSDIKRKYSKILKLPNVKIFDKIVTREKLESIYRSSDVLLVPCCNGAPAMVTLEGMSYGLPVITTNGGLSKEIQNLRTGIVIETSEKPPNDAKKCHYYYLTISKKPRLDVVKGLVDKVSILIEDSSLRRELGEEGIKEIKNGIFSIKERNRKLKRIFEEAII